VDQAILKHRQGLQAQDRAQNDIDQFKRSFAWPPAVEHRSYGAAKRANPNPVPLDIRPIHPHTPASASGIVPSRRIPGGRKPHTILYETTVGDCLPYQSPVYRFSVLLQRWRPITAAVTRTPKGKLKIVQVRANQSTSTLLKTTAKFSVAVAGPKSTRLFPLRFRISVCVPGCAREASPTHAAGGCQRAVAWGLIDV
jgi:hypothetical protein